MVKTKKGKKEVVSGDEMENNVQVKNTISSDEEDANIKSKKNKKEKKKVAAAGKVNETKAEKVDSDEDVEQLAKNVKKMNVTAGKKKSKKVDSDFDDDAGREEDVAKTPKKTGFDLLMADDDDNDDDIQAPESISDTEPDIGNKTSKTKKKEKTENEDKGKSGKKSKKSKKKKDEDDEDIDKVLAELEMEYSGEKKEQFAEPLETVAATAEDIEEEGSKKKKKDKKKAQSIPQEEPTPSEGNDDELRNEEEKSTVKTAAQKKKEKKERQKREAALAKQKVAEEKEQPDKVETVSTEIEQEKPPEEQKEQSVEPEENADEDTKKDDKKKKKKDKGKKEKEEEKEKDKKKGINKALVAAMQERVKKMKEEEERLKREEEERIKREEEREQQRLELIRLEQERKEKRKQKEAERKARLKAEGKLLSKKQKEDRARAQAMLEALKAQGVEIPDPNEKRPVRPGTRIRPNKKNQKNKQEHEGERDDDSQAKEDSSKDTTPAPEDRSKEDDVKDEWDASSSENDEKSEEKPIKDKGKSTTTKLQEKTNRNKSTKGKDETESESESSEEDSSEEDSEDEKRNDAEAKREKAINRIERRRQDYEKNRTLENLRAAIVCVLGHVDTGKTKILDKLRRTHVQDSEAGGITQQIGATNVPIDAIKDQTKIVKGSNELNYKLPGLLIIDTPGHESFSNLRSRGSSLCDIAILVVDIMHGLEPQTIESINLLKAKKTPFIVALNKIDRLYDWQTMPRKDLRDIIKGQQSNTQLEFTQRTKEVILQFAEQGLNAALFYENPDPRTYVSLVPTSAITGEGMGNLLYLIVEFCQNLLTKRLMYSDELQATVLEVKAIPGLGTTIDCILINGKLREGETIVVAGTDGPIVTQIRSLLMPQPMKELRVKNAYMEYKEIKAAQGVKIAAKDLEKAIAGINLLVAHKPDEVEICK